jgi:hypothetical protein
MAADESKQRAGDCAATSARIAAFIDGGLSGSESAAMREHRRVCKECDEEWRASLSTTAHLHHRGRVGAREDDRAARRAHNRRLALEGALATPTRPGRRVRRARLRLLLLPALAIFLMAVIYPGSRRSVSQLEALSGRVELAYRSLVPDDGSFTVRRGDWFETGPDARARLTLGPADIEVEPSSRVLIEDRASGRVRLIAGTLSLRGDGIVTADAGVVQVQAGEGRVSARPDGLEVAAASGTVLAAHSGGEETVPPGERTRLSVR